MGKGGEEEGVRRMYSAAYLVLLEDKWARLVNDDFFFSGGGGGVCI